MSSPQMATWQQIVDVLSILSPILIPPLLAYIGYVVRGLNKKLELVEEHDRMIFGDSRGGYAGVVPRIDSHEEEIDELWDRVHAWGYTGRGADKRGGAADESDD